MIDHKEKMKMAHFDIDKIKVLATEGGRFYADPEAEKALRELFITIPAELKKAQEQAQEAILRQTGRDSSTSLNSDTLSVKITKRNQRVQWADKTNPNPDYAKQITFTGIDNDKVKAYEEANLSLPSGIVRPDPVFSFKVEDIKND